MDCDVYMHGAVKVIKPSGDIRVKRVPELRQIFEDTVSESATKVAIDLSKVSFIDSSGIGLMVNFAKRLMGGSGSLCLVKANQELKDLLDVAGIYELIPIYKDLDEL